MFVVLQAMAIYVTWNALGWYIVAWSDTSVLKMVVLAGSFFKFRYTAVSVMNVLKQVSRRGTVSTTTVRISVTRWLPLTFSYKRRF